MFIIQVTINPADQNPTIFVADPLGNRHEVDAAHHGVADEVVAAIVEPETFYPGNVSGLVECAFKGLGGHLCGW